MSEQHSRPLYGAIDLGGTNVRAVVADLDGKIYGEDIRLSETTRGPEPVFDRMVETLTAASGQAGVRAADLHGLGIASPGPVNVETGIVPNAPQLPGWNEVPLVDIMQQRLGIDVVLENDANAGALGENRYGAGRGARHMLYMTISTGVGGGIIIDGRLYRGASGAAGELGHVMIEPNGPQCGCGAHGCLESLASGTAIARRGAEELSRGSAKLLREIVGEGTVTASAVAKAAGKGDEDCARIFKDVGHYLGIALAGYVNIFSPEAIVIGGGVTLAADLFMPEARAGMNALAMGEPLRHIRLDQGALGDRVSVLGMIARLAEKGTEPVT